MERNNLLFLIALVVGLGVAYFAVDQAYSTGKVVASSSCVDSDGGKNYNVTGVVSYDGKNYTDFCSEGSNKVLMERYCLSNGQRDTYGNMHMNGYYECPNGCKNGACLPSSTSNAANNSIPCKDSDNGLNYYIKGNVSTLNNRGGRVVVVDSCSTYKVNGLYQVTEWYCRESGVVDAKRFGCPAGCKNGACLQQTNQTQTNQASGCTDSDGGKDYEKRGSVLFNKINYSDTCLPNYPDYLNEYYCNKGLAQLDQHKCLNGCKGGACVKQEAGTCLSAGFGFTDVFLKCRNNNFNYNDCEPTSGFWGNICESNLNETQDYQTVCYAGKTTGNWTYCPTGCKDGACTS